MFLNDLLQYSRKNMDENEAYNRELKGNKRGYLYNIMTNPNYKFTDATRKGAGQNLGFDVEMPQNPQEQYYQLSNEATRRAGYEPLDQQFKPTRIVQGSAVNDLFTKETSVSKANQGYDNFMRQQDARQDYTEEVGDHLGFLRNALGAGSGEQFKANTWDPLTTGNPGTVYTSGHGTGSIKSYPATREQKTLPHPVGGSSKIDPESKPTIINYTVNGKPRGSLELKYGIKPVTDQIKENQEVLLKIAQVGKTFIDPITNKPTIFNNKPDLAKYLNDYMQISNGVLKQISSSKPGKPIEVDSANYDIAMGLKEVIAQEGPPEQEEDISPETKWESTDWWGLGLGESDSTATIEDIDGTSNKIKKLKNGDFFENDKPVEIGYLRLKYPKYKKLF
jgi:hypothetical protein